MRQVCPHGFTPSHVSQQLLDVYEFRSSSDACLLCSMRFKPKVPTLYTAQRSALPQIPMRRDAVKVGASRSLVLRFKADSPGMFLLHYHIEWHAESGLSATFVEAPAELQKHFPHGVLRAQRETCRRQGCRSRGTVPGGRGMCLICGNVMRIWRRIRTGRLWTRRRRG
ncbi:uncharacterized protein BDZ99DRAFT_119587 [Mytilinidion resinicola]|uniref:Plastocyanin-like domain-containing protein n=1 Tax=Mytilinidion resinicola TaxID=574789 RepID=A0A6A6Z482_9PEZI|nr:uncharacterized protein BDZ99DRAFT_119587 [Mytilinidion resinicola]KAF2815628.1 hypothetical protein BDZ99DRAFT_119587 [Mytilinidion resinicola]